MNRLTLTAVILLAAGAARGQQVAPWENTSAGTNLAAWLEQIAQQVTGYVGDSCATGAVIEAHVAHVEDVTNAVKRLAKDGTICAVLGHQWRDGRPGEGDGIWYADSHPGVFYRTCRICGRCESQEMGPWR